MVLFLCMNLFSRSLLFFTIAIFSVSAAIQAQGIREMSIVDFVNTRLADQRSSDGKPKKLDTICPIETDPLSARIFREYGAVFVSIDSVTMPAKCIYESEADLAVFQNGLRTETATIGGTTIELQADAMAALKRAVAEAERRRLKITPRGGSTAAARTFADTQRLWDSRFLPGLEHWISKGKISRADANAVRNMRIPDQVRKVLDWESLGYFFSTNKNRTILSSVAAPGTSQHLSKLALDVTQFSDPLVRLILNMNGWYQTVADDTPHFTYIGVPETQLKGRGLRPVMRGGFTFWVPNI